MITSYSTFVGYFRDLAQSNLLLNDFVVGNSERILNRELSNIQYPILWLEVPDISLQGRTEFKERYTSAFLVLKNAPADDWTREESDLDDTQTIVRQVLAKMQQDADDGAFEFDISNCSIMHKGKWSGDNDWGWRVEFELVIPLNDCYDEADWA